jgi:hypothetical protein
MALCSHCRRRKAKRHCPALRQELCQLCCGELRQKKINCPAACPYLKHEAYQEERQSAKAKGQPKPGLDEERLVRLIGQVETAIYHLAQENKTFSDQDALESLEYAREKIAAGGSKIIVPGKTASSFSSSGEIILKVIENARFEPSLLLQISGEAYSQEEKLASLEALIRFIRKITAGNLSRRVYLGELSQRLAQAQKEQRTQKIILP